jgi:hypothetical protein
MNRQKQREVRTVGSEAANEPVRDAAKPNRTSLIPTHLPCN